MVKFVLIKLIKNLTTEKESCVKEKGTILFEEDQNIMRNYQNDSIGD